ncbi:MAG: glutamate 5-kinase [Gammaproteobacteria bacterium]|nr:glutamate 5-kinase [Gammaproteobacteria bacterium]
MTRERLIRARRWVVKVGSSMVTGHGRGLDHAAISDWAAQLAVLRGQDRRLAWVSSGAVAEGMARLGLSRRPQALHELQATAAVGQMGLVRAYETAFAEHGLCTAQVLLTHEDVTDRARYLNARGTLRELLELGAVPVINENDTVATDEIRLGDNDTLAALTCNLLDAEVLVLLTDQDGFYDADPRRQAGARRLPDCALDDPRLEAMAGDSGGLGRGGMRTKLKAAQWAARSGAATVIVHGREPQVLLRLAAGEMLGTLLVPTETAIGARKRWIAHRLQVRGRLYLDAGAVKVLCEAGRSLLPVGVLRVEGEFRRGDLLACLDPDGQEVARGLTHYSSEEVRRIAGATSARLAGLLGYPGEPELIHRDDLVLTS